MRDEQAYLDYDLQLTQLATAIGGSTKELSQAINQASGENFYDFVNNYRIEEAKSLLISQPLRAVQDIGLAAGFLNRATFYRQFKKRVGMTPAQYRKSDSNVLLS